LARRSRAQDLRIEESHSTGAIGDGHLYNISVTIQQPADRGSEKRRAYFDPRLPRVGEDGHLVLTGPVIGSSYEPNRRASTSAIDPEQSFAACKVPAGYRHHKIPVLGYPNSSWISGKKIGNHRGEPHAITEWYAYHGQHTLQQSNKAGLPK